MSEECRRSASRTCKRRRRTVVRREPWMKHEAEHSAVREVVHVGAKSCEGVRRRVRQVVADLDRALLLRDEDTAVRSEPDRDRREEIVEDGRLLETCGQRARPRPPPKANSASSAATTSRSSLSDRNRNLRRKESHESCFEVRRRQV